MHVKVERIHGELLLIRDQINDASSLVLLAEGVQHAVDEVVAQIIPITICVSRGVFWTIEDIRWVLLRRVNCAVGVVDRRWES